MENKEKQYKYIKFFTLISFFIFFTLYASNVAGFYEYSQYKKVTLTEEQIKQFESDILAGKDVDIKNYTETDHFNNRKKGLYLSVSDAISEYTQKGINEVFKMLNNFVEN